MRFITQQVAAIPKWQRLKQQNADRAVQMAIDLVEKRKGSLYCSVVKDYFRRDPSSLGRVVERLSELNPTYPSRLIALLEKDSHLTNKSELTEDRDADSVGL